MKNIVLTGFMGAGKTFLAEILAKRLNRRVVSTDDMIVKREKRSINDIFRDSGEPYFRRVEKEVVAQIAREEDLVIDCGGGVVMDPDNMRNLKANGIIFYLSASPQELYRRTKDAGHRPLLQTETPLGRIKELFKKREPYYRQADYIMDTENKTGEEIAQDIMAMIKKSESRKPKT